MESRKPKKISDAAALLDAHVALSIVQDQFGSEGYQALIAIATVMSDDEVIKFAANISDAIRAIKLGGY